MCANGVRCRNASARRNSRFSQVPHPSYTGPAFRQGRSVGVARAVSIKSMTGYARAMGRCEEVAWTWEIKSVNGRGLDLRSRVPPDLGSLDVPIRTLLGKRLTRGSVSVNLQIERAGTAGAVRINEGLLQQALALADELERRTGSRVSADGLIALRGLIEVEEPDADEAARKALEQALLESLEEAVAALIAEREKEGANLEGTIAAFVDEIEALTAEARALGALQPERLRESLQQSLADLVADTLPEERLLHEVALLAAKGDIREELDRLDAHVEAARGLLAEEKAVGRRLDFLCQEFNREANTLCSKSSDIALTRIGLDLKAVIDRLREQIQNVE